MNVVGDGKLYHRERDVAVMVVHWQQNKTLRSTVRDKVCSNNFMNSSVSMYPLSDVPYAHSEETPSVKFLWGMDFSKITKEGSTLQSAQIQRCSVTWECPRLFC